ncbi:D-serine ammonia-lyase [Glutamicibacter sp. MNS18]|uniref:D-serine ammonia-lyase n=1 Tax=Glutamicibacter sp. MNS18 TaxID=2989817 RepID=UPI0022367BA6|nr:D-serine ammonia-lyase [Glutamicibacter sp. MNS18]MCW4465413.1 D-serine ammonia-lyase [Glutamicibacter sp. MNS18]
MQGIFEDPVIAAMAAGKETTWFRQSRTPTAQALSNSGLDPALIDDASDRFQRFAPWILREFPETGINHGILESPVHGLPRLQTELDTRLGRALGGKLWLKRDDLLPVAGSIKARGGIHEVLQVAERFALEAGVISPDDDYTRFADQDVQAVLGRYGIMVGSTGNLGLSIGITAARLGLRTTVHMSADARDWKKQLLRSHGVTVVEHQGDFSQAVDAGRAEAAADSTVHFVDDENSLPLFAGYAVAARRLEGQLRGLGITVDGQHPLMVYLPCGVGGSPGGVTFGLKHVFGDNVHCYFAEPANCPAVTLGVRTGLHEKISAFDLGLDGKTTADGLAVARPSELVGRALADVIDGYCTVTDEKMQALTALLDSCEGIRVEPSATAGLLLPWRVFGHPDFAEIPGLVNATHLVWCTGGSMVPEDEMARYLAQGQQELGRIGSW